MAIKATDEIEDEHALLIQVLRNLVKEVELLDCSEIYPEEQYKYSCPLCDALDPARSLIETLDWEENETT